MKSCAQLVAALLFSILGCAAAATLRRGTQRPQPSPSWLQAAGRRFAQRFADAEKVEQASGLGREDLSFLQLRAEAVAEAHAKNGPLYGITVKYDWQNHDASHGVSISTDKDTHSLKMIAGHDPEGSIATGLVEDKLDKTGWIELYLRTTDTPGVPNDVKMYTAGFIEGMLTAVRMSQFYTNFYQTMMKDEATAQALTNIRKMFLDELDFVMKNSNIHSGATSVEPMDPLWQHARYIYVQLWGIKDGYNYVAVAKGVRTLDMVDMLVINSHGELPELLEAYTPAALLNRLKFQQKPITLTSLLQKSSQTPSASKSVPSTAEHLRSRAGNVSTGRNRLSPLGQGSTNASAHNATELSAAELAAADNDWEMRLAKHGHCSALVRVATGNKDLLVGHTTWNDYSKMTRVFKYYHINLPNSRATTDLIAFSSYPGCVSSTDDFYMMNSGLAVMDTSLEILNAEAYDRVAEFPTNSHLPNFMHVMVANRIAKTGPHWASIMSEQNSGTNNAQWMIVDYNLFFPGQPIRDGTLFVMEQVPGMIQKADMSHVLRDKGYWASFNRPYFDKTREIAGHTAAQKAYGALYSYADSPRAQIFNGLAPSAESTFDMRSIMNRNEWPKEGTVPPSPGHAISARLDLAYSKIPNGGIDAKVLGRCLMRSLQCQAISGPSHARQPVFKWKQGDEDLFGGWPHLGLPDVWDFDWVQMTPSRALPTLLDMPTC
mmetsp:Transcript_93569/g.171695  ORF Transcript_93569/g.171695 Transcript_93569/m.171695 type:complete len:716 (+) Transcript_93569:76-2223(+)